MDNISKKRAVNDSTLTKIGDFYQYFIALQDCFNMTAGDVIQIEVSGDVSLISKNETSFQKEVKHHISEDYLTDRDIDFWKTLANWYSDYERIENFDKLILYTTSNVKSDSPFNEWNTLSNLNKLDILEKIGETKKERETLFRKQYNRIFNEEYNEKVLLSILAKFDIEIAKPNIVGISNSFAKYIRHIPDKNKDEFIYALLGRMVEGIQNPPHKIIISQQKFDQIVQIETGAYRDEYKKSLPKFYEKEIIKPEEKEKYENKQFVLAIKDINYDKKIPKAIEEYWKTIMTIQEFFNDDSLYLESLEEYKNDLLNNLVLLKEKFNLDADDIDKSNREILSKKLYNEAMLREPFNFGSIINNRLFFQHGVMHNIVDEGDFKWKIGGEGEY